MQNVSAALILCLLLLPSAALAADHGGPNFPDKGMDTGSPDMFHYYDPNTREEVWGVRAPQQTPEEQPSFPLIIAPEIDWRGSNPGHRPRGHTPPPPPSPHARP